VITYCNEAVELRFLILIEREILRF